VVDNWREWQDRARASQANLGTLSGQIAALSGGCVQAVGPGAALAAADAQGHNQAYVPVDRFLSGGAYPECRSS